MFDAEQIFSIVEEKRLGVEQILFDDRQILSIDRQNLSVAEPFSFSVDSFLFDAEGKRLDSAHKSPLSPTGSILV
ncbi:MAG: hypothetical protein ICV60_17430 [Pyrinomonadaceae bacterium]|nr:hypothetical protein [Pyrinomonadaceae bacterium]